MIVLRIREMILDLSVARVGVGLEMRFQGLGPIGNRGRLHSGLVFNRRRLRGSVGQFGKLIGPRRDWYLRKISLGSARLWKGGDGYWVLLLLSLGKRWKRGRHVSVMW